MKDDLIKAIRWFGEKGGISKGCNSSFLTLIPKIENPTNLSDFIPISIIGVFYKIIAKLLVERVKSAMGKIISDTQSAFIKDRITLNGVLVTNEVIDYVRRKKEKRVGIHGKFLKGLQ